MSPEELQQILQDAQENLANFLLEVNLRLVFIFARERERERGGGIFWEHKHNIDLLHQYAALSQILYPPVHNKHKLYMLHS